MNYSHPQPQLAIIQYISIKNHYNSGNFLFILSSIFYSNNKLFSGKFWTAKRDLVITEVASRIMRNIKYWIRQEIENNTGVKKDVVGLCPSG